MKKIAISAVEREKYQAKKASEKEKIAISAVEREKYQARTTAEIRKTCFLL